VSQRDRPAYPEINVNRLPQQGRPVYQSEKGL
jgi:hypothetical protein